MMTATTSADRYIFRCKRCNVTIARDYVNTNYRVVNGLHIDICGERCPCCNRTFAVMPSGITSVHGRYNPNHKCSAKCTNAVSGACDCSCGGANHGAGHLA